MALDLLGLRTEVIARGFDYLPTGRIDRFINDANYAIEEQEAWNFLQASTVGVAPLTIADLGQIQSVADVTNLNPLGYKDQADIVDGFADLTSTSGMPWWYYLTGGNVLNTFPVSPVSLTVKYYKVSPVLVADADVPLMPDRFRYAIVEYAVAKALRDVSNYGEAQAATAEGDVIVGRMREWDLLQQGASNDQLITGSAGDW